jgi:hypothetical protein
MLPRGSAVDILFKDESTYGTAPSGNWTKSFIYSHGIEEKAPLEDDPLLGQPRQNDRDATSQAPGLPTHGGPMVVPLCLNHFGYWLKLAMGAPVTDATGDPNFVHTFKSGGSTLPSRSIEIKTPIVGANIFPRHTGVMLDKFAVEVSRAGNYERVNLDLVGKTETKLTSTGGGTPASALALDRILNTQGIFKVGGVQADIISISATYDNKLTPLDFVGDVYASGYDSDQEAAFTGSIRLRMKTAAFYDLAAAGTLSTAEILFQKSATRLLSLATSNMRLERTGFPVTGPGALEQTFNFRCQQDSTNPMLTAVLKNGQAAAVYA